MYAVGNVVNFLWETPLGRMLNAREVIRLAFAAARGWTFYGSQINHRNFQSHAPVIWLLAGLLVFFLARGPYWKAVGLLLWLASWSHFLLDTIEYGIMWGWPLSSRIVALRCREVRYSADRGDFFGYWFGFLRWYATTRVSFWLELAVIFSGIYVFISNHVR
jgi:membrane-bound metal-dependent hydrolase YbcI (DUF457 family)